MKLKELRLLPDIVSLGNLPEGKLLINTINAHSFNMARKDPLFAEALTNCDVLIPDGASVVAACKYIGTPDTPKQRVAGWDFFMFEMNRLNIKASVKPGEKKYKVMFLGSSEYVLSLIKDKMKKEYPCIDVVTYSPPFVEEFTNEQTNDMLSAINDAKPSLLWIGMTAPKQEKWAYINLSRMQVDCHIGAIGAVFDFFAGTSKRAPIWWQQHGIEWLYRLVQDPSRMWRRYLIGNAIFIFSVIKEKLFN